VLLAAVLDAAAVAKRNVPVDVPAAELAINWDLQAFFALTPRVQRENINPIRR
jgi:hypothetical protein